MREFFLKSPTGLPLGILRHTATLLLVRIHEESFVKQEKRSLHHFEIAGDLFQGPLPETHRVGRRNVSGFIQKLFKLCSANASICECQRRHVCVSVCVCARALSTSLESVTHMMRARSPMSSRGLNLLCNASACTAYVHKH